MNVSRVATTMPAPKPNRMTLANVRKGPQKIGHRVLVYGSEKVGKSTFAAGAPAPIFLGKDSGTEHLDIDRLPQPENWREVLDALALIENESHSYHTLVLDPVNWLEPLINADVVGESGKSIEAWDGGFGRGYDAAIDRWRVLVAAVERIWSKRTMNVIFVAHAVVKKFNDPEGPGYERYEIEMANRRAAAVLKQWVDSILFARREAFGKIEPTTKRAKAYGSAARMLHTEWSPAFDAGNRWTLPPELPMSWSAYSTAVNDLSHMVELLEQIEAGLKELADPETERKVRAFLKSTQNTSGKYAEASLVEAANAVAAKLGERRATTEGATT